VIPLLPALTVLLLGATTAPAPPTAAELHDQVRSTEIAFAQTMADRDFEAFQRFLSPEAVFVSSRQTLHGAAQIADGWRALYDGEEAPFSWRPELVEVLDSGTLALTSGPVLDATGASIGTFNSVWRRDADGRWRIVFDKGCPPCGDR
jgi:ketosteroid isomerase-like protein